MSPEPTLYGGHKEQSDRLPPYLLDPHPRWHPGAWMPPPGEALSFASAAVLLFLILFLCGDALRRSFFRFPALRPTFPYDDLYLLVPLAAFLIALLIFRRCSSRPGGKLPHWWSLILVMIGVLTFIYGIIDRIWWTPYRGNPLVHIFAASALFSALTLLPRLVRVYPDSSLVQNAAPLAFLLVLPVGLGSAWYVSEKMIAQEQDRVLASVKELNGLADELGSATGDAANSSTASASRLEAINILSSLPDAPVWTGARILTENSPKNTPAATLQPDLKTACENLIAAAVGGLTSESRPILRMPAFRLHEWGPRWDKINEYDDAMAASANYYRQLGRILRELDTLHSTDAEPSLNDAHQKIEQTLAEWETQFNQRWMVSLIDPARKLPNDIGRLVIGPGGNLFANLPFWKKLKFRESAKFTASRGPCVTGPDTIWQRKESIQVPDPTPEEPQKMKWILVTFFYHRLECYSYVVNEDEASVGMSAELHLIYKSRGGFDFVRPESLPLQVFMYFHLPAKGSVQRQDEMMQALGSAYQSIYRSVLTPLQPVRSRLPDQSLVAGVQIK